ncbi:MAG: hypothetical protein LBD24_02240 [Spirochaetaceae bacterium]|nr:hypothetical protein [Spirochaetaceae bacterium]
MHQFETTGGHAETAGGCAGVAAPGPCKPAHRTRCCTIKKQQAAMLKQPEAAPRTTTVRLAASGGWGNRFPQTPR